MKLMNLFTGIVVVMLTWMAGCKEDDHASTDSINYRQEMRHFVQGLSSYSKNIHGNFIIIPQNGQELITDNGEGNGTPQTAYLNAIDATGREGMFYGYHQLNEQTPEDDRQRLLSLCLLCEQYNVEVLATDYCSTHSKMDNSYQVNEQNGFISFAAEQRELNGIPGYPTTPYNENVNDVTHISQAKNFLYLINSENFDTKRDFINAVSTTNYDMVIMDLYHNEEAYTSAEIARLKTKQNGRRRLIICYMSIGEAENYRYYWQSEWAVGNPTWIEKENPDWAGNFKVKYWRQEWKNIIYGNDKSYLKRIIDAGFNGVYLDIIDAFEYYEAN